MSMSLLLSPLTQRAQPQCGGLVGFDNLFGWVSVYLHPAQITLIPLFSSRFMLISVCTVPVQSRGKHVLRILYVIHLIPAVLVGAVTIDIS